MNTTPRSSLKFVVIFLVYIALSLFVSIYSSKYSSDAAEYRLVYESIGSNEIAFYKTGRAEIFYYFWNWVSSSVGLSFESFLFVSTFLFLSLKINALHVISRGGSKFQIIVLYLLIFFLLHEGIQYKIAWGLSIALWACVFFSRGQWTTSAFCALLAAGLHVSAVLLPLSFFFAHIFLLRYRISKIKSLLIYLSVGYVVVFGFAHNLIAFIDSRYFDYLDENRLSIQNSSGMFYYYVAGLSLMVWWLSWELRNLPDEISISIFLTIISVVVLYVLHKHVSMASRLSDVFLVMIIPLMIFITRTNRKIYALPIVYSFAFAIFVGRLMFNWQILI